MLLPDWPFRESTVWPVEGSALWIPPGPWVCWWIGGQDWHLHSVLQSFCFLTGGWGALSSLLEVALCPFHTGIAQCRWQTKAAFLLCFVTSTEHEIREVCVEVSQLKYVMRCTAAGLAVHLSNLSLLLNLNSLTWTVVTGPELLIATSCF